MKMASIIGQILLWAGFLSGSLATVFSLEKPERWSTINWPWYLASTFVCVLGITAIRVSKMSDGKESEQSLADYSTLAINLGLVIENLAKLRESQSNMRPSEMVAFIDANLADGLREFADAREAIIPQQGLHHYADIMTQFAAGERAINRAWSAAADGYVDEVEICLDRANAFFENAKKLLI